MSDLLDKAAWLSEETRTATDLPLPEFGGRIVKLRPLSTDQWLALPKDDDERMREVLRQSIVDESGEPMFTLDEITAMRKKHHATVFQKLHKRIAELNGWTTDPEGDAKN